MREGKEEAIGEPRCHFISAATLCSKTGVTNSSD
jgi:hypothetical protein